MMESHMQWVAASARSHTLVVSVGLFLVLYAVLCKTSPSFAFDRKGRAKQFGIGIKTRTVTPVWLITIILAITSYLFVLYVSNSHTGSTLSTP